jgi:hypothetical protein
MNVKPKLAEDKYAGTGGMFRDLLDKWNKESEQAKLREKIIQARKKLDAEKANISDEEYKEAKAYIDSKEAELKENNMYNKNTMDTRAKKLINRLVQEEISLLEKKKKDELPPIEDIEIDEPTDDEASLDIDIAPAEEAPAMDMGTDMSMDMSGGDASEKAIGQGLQMALDAAKQLPDGETKDKLIRQIGNTALFFLKTQIPTSGQA